MAITTANISLGKRTSIALNINHSSATLSDEQKKHRGNEFLYR